MMDSENLWKKIEITTQKALLSGSLQPLSTTYEIISQGGVNFVIYILSSLVEKEKQKQKSGSHNPFLPYEKDLFVAKLSSTHVILLNKFNVMRHHILIVTREFEDQENLLTLEDFKALWQCLWKKTSLGFYNGGTIAGASQPHKHLQCVPLPLSPKNPSIPMESLFSKSKKKGIIHSISELPFPHAFVRFEKKEISSPQQASYSTLKYYLQMLYYLGIQNICQRKLKQNYPYNLLITQEWILLVPRSQEHFASISFNALAFAGSFLVRTPKEKEILKQYGPMNVLQTISRI